MLEPALAELVLNVVVFAAALFQAMTGIGFALIAGPVFLLVMDTHGAIQVSILLNLLMALSLSPFLYRHCKGGHLRQLLGGTAIGMPLGILLFLALDLSLLKLVTGLLLGATVLAARLSPSLAPGSARLGGIGAGTISGAMAGFAAMPGPAVSLYLTLRGDLTGNAVRATIFMLFICSYAAALGLHWTLSGIDAAALAAALRLIPATACGMLAGYLLTPHVRQRDVDSLIFFALVLTAIALVLSALA